MLKIILMNVVRKNDDYNFESTKIIHYFDMNVLSLRKFLLIFKSERHLEYK